MGLGLETILWFYTGYEALRVLDTEGTWKGPSPQAQKGRTYAHVCMLLRALTRSPVGWAPPVMEHVPEFVLCL